MEKFIHTEIKIKTSKEEVWKLLMDFQNYPNWNPFIQFIEGTPRLGERLKIAIQTTPGKQMKFSPVVNSLIPYEEFSWKGKLFFNGLFDGHHRFELKELENGEILLKHSEKFTGILVPVINLKNTRKGFVKMNEMMKDILEQLNT
jgi:hypothetical protein